MQITKRPSYTQPDHRGGCPSVTTHGMQPAPDNPDMSARIARHTREARDRARWGHGKYRGKA